MKALYYIFGIALLTLASCSSGLYVGTEYDDLYYQSSDQPVITGPHKGQSAGCRKQPAVRSIL